MTRRASQYESEELQVHILSILEHNDIPDTRTLKLADGSEVGPQPDEQIVIKAALDSLAAKEVGQLERYG